MVGAPMVGLMLLKMALRGIDLAALGVGRAAFRLAQHGARRRSGVVKAAAYLAIVADRLLGKLGSPERCRPGAVQGISAASPRPAVTGGTFRCGALQGRRHRIAFP